MTLGKLFLQIAAGEPIRTRGILPKALVKRFDIDVELSPPNDVFPSKFYQNLVPSFEWSDGTLLAESVPINLLLIDQVPQKGGLMGDDSPKTRSSIMQWMLFANYDIMGPGADIFRMLVGRAEKNEAVYDFSWNLLNKANDIMEKHLRKQPYLVGEKLTLADLFAAQMYLRGLQHYYDAEWKQNYSAIWKWFQTVVSHEIYKDEFPEIEPLDKFVSPFSK